MNIKVYDGKPEKFVVAFFKENGLRVKLKQKVRWKSKASFLKSLKSVLSAQTNHVVSMPLNCQTNMIFLIMQTHNYHYRISGVDNCFKTLDEVANYIIDNFFQLRIIKIKELEEEC